ncbi:MAG: polysaccharide biosynthesis tyrosine autokinase [Opitutaceae bacterium]|jgi:capsular exopolysaccharide synthesis family protein
MADAQQQKPPIPVSPAHAKEDDEIIEHRTLRDYYIILRERLWIALPLALLISISLGYYQSRETPLYMSRATMQFEKPDKIVTTQGVSSPEVTSEVDINTYIEVLRSSSLRSRVVQSLSPDEVKILQRPYLKNLPAGVAPPSAGEVLAGVDIGSVRNSYLISITATHRDPEAASIVANRYVEQFMQHLFDQVGGKNEFAVEWMKQRADQMRKESEEAAAKVQRFMQQHQLVSLDDSSNLIANRLQAVEADLTKTRLARIEIESQFAQVQTFLKEGRNLMEINLIANYDQVPNLKNQVADLSREESILAEKYLERHPKMIEVSNRISVAQEQLDRAVKLAVAELQTRLEKVISSEQSLEKEKKVQEQAFFNLRDLRTEYDSLKNEETVSKKNFMEILDRLNQINTTKNLEKIPLHPLDKAVPSGAPYTPNITRIMKTCTGVFVLVFVAVAVGLSFVDDRIKSAWDVEHFIGVTLLGIVPDMGNVKDEDKYQIVLNNKQTPGLEAFLSVYSSVKIHSKLDFPKSILVTSTIPGEGKTLISCNIAGSFARHGRSTLLIDCDLRRPMLHRHFKQPNNSGLISWYENGADLESDLVGNPNLGLVKVAENLTLLCSGGRSKTPSELLESVAFAQLLEKLKHRFDLIVVDSPPLGAVTDSLLIAERIDEVIYVCRFNRAYRKHIRLYVKALRSGKNEILGIILNGLSPRRIEYYSNYRYYRSYKKYYGAQT